MRKAWGENYLAINEVRKNLFLACFESHSKMLNILKRQPWVVGRRDILIFEWFDPSKPFSSYTFQYIHATIRLFGVPPDLKNIPFINTILSKVAAPSDYDQITSGALNRDPLFIPIRAKIDITKKAVDRLKLATSTDASINIFIHYEKIPKSVPFTAGFFHNVTSCLAREQKLLSASKSNSSEIAFIVYGPWMTQISEIPIDQVRLQISSTTTKQTTVPTLLHHIRQQFAVHMPDDLAFQTTPCATHSSVGQGHTPLMLLSTRWLGAAFVYQLPLLFTPL